MTRICAVVPIAFVLLIMHSRVVADAPLAHTISVRNTFDSHWLIKLDHVYDDLDLDNFDFDFDLYFDLHIDLHDQLHHIDNKYLVGSKPHLEFNGMLYR